MNFPTYYDLLRKYKGNIEKASYWELKIAARNTNNPVIALAEAIRKYEDEAQNLRQCFNKNNHCEEDNCRCYY